MEILEHDIFNYIFYPNILDKEKYSYLGNCELFKEEFELLKKIENFYNEIIPDDIIERIKSLIATNNKIVRLEKKKDNTPSKSNRLVLAADGPKIDKHQAIETFEDENSKYLIKVISNDYSNKVFLFTRENQEMHNVKLNFEPSGQSYIMVSSNKPIIISPKQEITNIALITES